MDGNLHAQVAHAKAGVTKMQNSSTFQGLWTVFKGFSRQILFSRTFQDCPSSTFQACANPEAGHNGTVSLTLYQTSEPLVGPFFTSFSRWQHWWQSGTFNWNYFSCFFFFFFYLSTSHPNTSYQVSGQLAFLFKGSSLTVLGFNDMSTLVDFCVVSRRKGEETEEIVEEMKKRDREERGTGMKVNRRS